MTQPSKQQWPTPRVVVEVIEQPSEGGCGENDRRWFRRRTIPRLTEEFGEALRVRWREAPSGSRSCPLILVNGERMHEGGFLGWETLRPAVARALAVEWAVLQDHIEAQKLLADAGLEEDDWQDGLLAWLHRPEDDAERE